jgi:hypothetical protein
MNKRKHHLQRRYAINQNMQVLRMEVVSLWCGSPQFSIRGIISYKFVTIDEIGSHAQPIKKR